MILAEIAQNPVLEESSEGGEELTPEELQPLLEAERLSDPADQSILDMTPEQQEIVAAGVFEAPEPPTAEAALLALSLGPMRWWLGRSRKR